jgi:hypothetical protein
MGPNSPSNARWLPAALLPLITLAACGPVQSSTLIVDAQAELAAAQTAGGDRHAPFEYVAAEEYLHKAREEQSYADFEVSVELARKSRICARAAKLIAERATRTGMGVDSDSKKPIAPCRAGPDRGPGALAASEEPAARGLPVAAAVADDGAEEPASTVDARSPPDAAKSGEPEDPPPEPKPAPKKKVKPAAGEPDDPPPPPKAKPKKADPQPEPEALPEGDE